MACAHQHASQSILKKFIFVLIIQVEYIDGLSGDPDAVEDITSCPTTNQGILVEHTLQMIVSCLLGDPVQGRRHKEVTSFIRTYVH